MSGTSKTAIVSAADKLFFPMLRGLIHSLHDQGWARKCDLCVIDLGLEKDQRSELEPLVKRVLDGRWEYEFPKFERAHRWFQAMVSRPHLPECFPGYDVYIWIDADAWLADERAVDLLIDGAAEDGVAIVPEIHPSYAGVRSLNWINRQNIHRCYADAWGDAVANTLAPMPVLNSGVFAMRRDHPCWAKWAVNLREGLQKGTHMLVEQCALNLTLYRDGISYAPLPAWCNWVCHQAMPRYHIKGRRFEAPTRPYEPISIIHGAGNKHVSVSFDGPDGEAPPVAFDYLSLKQAGMI